MLKQLPIGIQTFSELIQKNYVYVDKTAIIYQLVTNKKYYFLNRPRRFGKSLLVSTLEAIFLGKKELFSSLAIDSLPYDWQAYPVVSLSFADVACTTTEKLESGIKTSLQRIAQSYNLIPLDEKLTPGEMLQALVIDLSQQNLVVLLIDEYDYAILQHIHNPEIADIMRETLKNFYAVIKGLDRYLRFAFLTGVSKFSQTSIFSGLNNVQDIGSKPEFNALLGYTYAEIVTFFYPHLINSAHILQCSIDVLLTKITEWYDGYLFTEVKAAEKIYNPFSVLLFFDNSRFSNYWFATGTPTFLVNLLKTSKYQMQEFDRVEAVEKELGAFDITTISLKTLLFQTGYLTIHSYDSETKIYILTYPNKETTESLADYLFDSVIQQPSALLYKTALSLSQAFENNNLENIKAILTHFFASIPYNMQLPEEKYYQLAFYIILKMVGAHIIAEQPTVPQTSLCYVRGPQRNNDVVGVKRIDVVIETKNSYFIIEMKINATAEVALKQIKEKKYYQRYESLGKKIILMGIAFDIKQKNIDSIAYESLYA